jgi:hypothetical protein
MGIRNVPLGTHWQSWNVFGLAMTLAPLILVVLEIFALIFILVIAFAVMLSEPGIQAEMQRLAVQMAGLDPQSDAAQELLAPYLVKPGVIAGAVLYFAVIVPLLEELLKPLGVWFFARQLTGPAQGFALGALSGAAYGLIETLGVSAQTADWASLLFTRIGTGTLHITTSGLMGAAIFYAIRERRYLRLLGMYALSVSLHGLWNALAILSAFGTLSELFGVQTVLREWTTPVNVALAIFTGILGGILVWSNRKMKMTLRMPVAQAPLPADHQQS